MKKLQNFLTSISRIINSLGTIAKSFYLILFLILSGIVVYSLILNSKVLIFSIVMVLSVCIKNLIKRFFKINESSIDPLSYVVFFARVILNRYFSIFSSVIVWDNKIDVERLSYKRNFKKILICFSNTLIHLFLLIIGIILVLILNKFKLFSMLAVDMNSKDPLVILSQASALFVIINLNYTIINLFPIAPFDMGSFLELSGSKIIKSINAVGSLIIVMFYYLGFWDNIFITVYRTAIRYFYMR